MNETESLESDYGKEFGFEMVAIYKFNDTIPIKKYKSTNTGMQVIFVHQKGPIVNGYFVVATEASDNDGLPHTLEHLIFLGSENYPYKGTLDAIANLCLASGTNAWTDIDHTAYTMQTAGSEGFVILLPTYLEHILFPTLTDAGYITEVHHITGEGTDAGVVYCEMQGRETCGEQLAEFELMKNLYPGECGYRFETGGIVTNLRESTSITKVRNYHKKFYRPENLILIISGIVSEAEVFNSITPIEKKLAETMVERERFVKPWKSPVPILKETCIKEIKYPCDKEDNGLVYIGWQGPPISDQKSVIACINLLTYLTETSAAPLTKYLVEVPDQLCSEVSFMLYEHATTVINLQFEDVPLDKISSFHEEVANILRSVVEDSLEKKFDLERMKIILSKWQINQALQMEKSAHKALTAILISDMIYSNTKEDTLRRLNPKNMFEALLKESKEFWLQLLNKMFVKAPRVVINATPSQDAYEQNTKNEEERIKKRCDEIGLSGLEEKRLQLESAFLENNIEPPNSILNEIKVPSVDKIQFYSIKNYNTFGTVQHPLLDARQCPVYMQIDDVPSHFVYLHVVLNTTELPTELRPYLTIFLEYILDAPIERNGEIIPHETVSKEMENDILSIKTSIGTSTDRFSAGQFSNAVMISYQVEPRMFSKCVQWVREMLFQTVLDPNRLSIFANKMIKSVSQYRRDGMNIVEGLMNYIHYRPGTNLQCCAALHMYHFLKDMLKKLKSKDNAQILSVLNDIEAMRKLITKPENIVVHLAANLKLLDSSVPNVNSILTNLLPNNASPAKRELQISPDHVFALSNKERLYGSCVVGMGSVDTAYLLSWVPCITDYYHPDYAPLMVAVQYLTQLEGPMWRKIRGFGLAYHHDLHISISEGTLSLNLYRATDVVEAYRKSHEICKEYIEKNLWEHTYFKSAKSSLAFEIAQKEKNIENLVFQSLYSYLAKTNINYNRELIDKVVKVEIDDMIRTAKEYLLKLFDPKLAKLAVVCNGSKCSDISRQFKIMGFDLKVYKTVEDSFLNPKSAAAGRSSG